MSESISSGRVLKEMNSADLQQIAGDTWGGSAEERVESPCKGSEESAREGTTGKKEPRLGHLSRVSIQPGWGRSTRREAMVRMLVVGYAGKR
jgi:hypothetical protein